MEDGKSLVVKISVSCVPGLEFITVSECNETFGVKSEKETRGRISFKIPINLLKLLPNLRSVHHYWLVVSELYDVWSEDDDKATILEKLEACVGTLPWSNAIDAYGHFQTLIQSEMKISGPLGPTNKTDDEPSNVLKSLYNNPQSSPSNVGQDLTNKSLITKEKSSTCASTPDNASFSNNALPPENVVSKTGHDTELNRSSVNKDIKQCSPPSKQRKLDKEEEPTQTKFRVTCSRNGTHCFTSMEAAKFVGSGVKGHFNWSVNLEKFDVEILCFIEGNKVTIAMKLSGESKHIRNVTHFGPTTLRATTAFCLLKLAGVKKGDIVCDPMCGTGAICLEGATSFPFSFQIGGENHNEGCANARKNFEVLEKNFGETKSSSAFSFPHTIVQWDARRMPLRDGLVDVIVCDMPFGKRIGYKGRNFDLYPAVLKDMGRICRTNGKAVLLTQHKSAMNKTLNICSRIWKKQASFFINMGGLNVGIYVLKKLGSKSKNNEILQ